MADLVHSTIVLSQVMSVASTSRRGRSGPGLRLDVMVHTVECGGHELESTKRV